MMPDRAPHSSRVSVFACVLATALAAAGLGLASRALAQVPRSSPNAQLIEEYQQAERARDQLQTQNAKLKQRLASAEQQLKAARVQLAAAKSSAGANRSALAAARAQSQGYASDLDRTRANLKKLIGQFGDTIVSLRALESNRDTLRQHLATTQADLNTCVERNADLYGVAEEVLKRYEHQGLFSYLARYEPFTRLEQTRIENFVDDYRQRAQELRAPPPSTAASKGEKSNATSTPAPPKS
jgi:chromosome segregation ATPase